MKLTVRASWLEVRVMVPVMPPEAMELSRSGEVVGVGHRRGVEGVARGECLDGGEGSAEVRNKPIRALSISKVSSKTNAVAAGRRTKKSKNRPESATAGRLKVNRH